MEAALEVSAVLAVPPCALEEQPPKTPAAIAAAIAAGYEEALLYDRKPKTLSELEKMMGKAEFADKLGAFVIKPPGKPTLAISTDAREPYSPAAADFAGVVRE